MNGLNVWQLVNVNRSNRPVIGDNEEILYVKDDVGLYQGKVKITNRQLGRLYLTNMRIIYIDNYDVTMSMALNIENVTNTELIEGFLKRSPKIKLFVSVKQYETTKTIDWVCKICSFNNHLQLPIDYGKLPKCVSCGILPTEKYIRSLWEQQLEPISLQIQDDQCPKCTFINHPSLRYCEMCGTELKTKLSGELVGLSPEAKNPLNIQLEEEEEYSGKEKYIKISFRDGGENKFHQLLNQTINDLKWNNLLKSGNVNKNAVKVNAEAEPTRFTESGIFKLQLISEQTRKQNELTLSSSLEDLDQLMYKAKDVIKLSNYFNKLIKPIKTYPVMGNFNINKESNVYHEELSRYLSEYLINFKLTKTSSMITTQDLFVEFNRFLILSQGLGYPLVSCDDFNKSINLFEKLNLPITLNVYDVGLRVLKPKYTENVSQLIVQYLNTTETEFYYQKFKMVYFDSDQDNYYQQLEFFKGSTVSEISEEFNWSHNITIEELDKLINNGDIVIDKSITGTFYFPNQFNKTPVTFDMSQFENRLEREENLRLEKEARELELATRNFGSEALNQLKGLQI